VADENKLIVMTAWRRPDYFQQVITALSRCDGVDEYSCLLHVEPGYQPVIDIAQQFAEARVARTVELVVNPERLGCNRNTLELLEEGFRRSERVIHLEDDTVPLGTDFLRYVEWGLAEYANNKQVFSICGFNRITPDLLKPENYYKVKRLCWFTPWGWASWRDRWLDWSRNRSNETPNASWDMLIGEGIMPKGQLLIHPLLPRIQNIGGLLGMHVPNAEWHRANHYCEFGSWSLPAPADTAQFYEVGV